MWKRIYASSTEFRQLPTGVLANFARASAQYLTSGRMPNQGSFVQWSPYRTGSPFRVASSSQGSRLGRRVDSLRSALRIASILFMGVLYGAFMVYVVSRPPGKGKGSDSNRDSDGTERLSEVDWMDAGIYTRAYSSRPRDWKEAHGRQETPSQKRAETNRSSASSSLAVADTPPPELPSNRPRDIGDRPGCEDTNAGCTAWAASGECMTNPSFMIHGCKVRFIPTTLVHQRGWMRAPLNLSYQSGADRGWMTTRGVLIRLLPPPPT